MEIKEIKTNKKEYLPLLLLADEQESMIDLYLERGRMFALLDPDVVAECVVTDEGGGVCELKNIAVEPQAQGKGYGRALVAHVCDVFEKTHEKMIVGTGAGTKTEDFYRKCGFRFSRLVQNFFTDNYDHEMVEDGVLLRDMSYFERALGGGCDDGKERLSIRLLRDKDVPLMREWLYKEHVRPWYEQPEEWLREMAERFGEFNFLRHFIVEYDGRPIGFCQYYACADAEEEWYGSVPVNGTYSIDYMIGDEKFLGQGLGKEVIALLVKMVFALDGAERIIVQPDEKNAASCGVLLANGFVFDEKDKIYCKEKQK